MSKIKILFLGSSPSDLSRVSVTTEVKTIQDRLWSAALRDRFELESQFEVSAASLPGLLMRIEPNIVHFCGHGSERSELMFHGPGGAAVPVEPEVISKVFGILRDELKLRCVILNACYTEPLAESITAHVDVVMGMSDALTDHSALAFAAGFYEALGYGRSVRKAFELGAVQVGLAGSVDGEILSLKSRMGVDPSQVFLHWPTGAESALEVGPADELQRLKLERERRALAGEDFSEIDQALVEVRRQIRSGPSLRSGDVLAERYALGTEIGTGGFATVWKAYDRKRSRSVAVKVLHGQWARDESRVARFCSGATRLEALDHPRVVSLLEPPRDGGPHVYCVMPLLQGGDLRHAVLRAGLSRAAALSAIADVLDALAFAHDRGVVHRDVKPGNILLDSEGRGYITDFDLAHAKDSTQGTRTVGMGTFRFAAPEQLSDASRVDARADIYSIGMTALFVLARKDPPPFVSRMEPEFFDQLNCGIGLLAALKLAVAYAPEARKITSSALAQAVRAEFSELPAGRTPHGLLEERLAALEQAFCELETPLYDRGRVGMWVELGSLQAALFRSREAGLCWSRAVWEQPANAGNSQLGVAQRWAESEREMLGSPDIIHMLGMVDVTEIDLDEQMVRALAAAVIYVELCCRAGETVRIHSHDSAVRVSLPLGSELLARLQYFFVAHGSLLDLRTLWLVRSALVRLGADEHFGLFQARDQIMAMLDQGAGTTRGIPAFVRTFDSKHRTSDSRLADELIRVRDEYLATRRRRSSTERTFPGAKTDAYVHLMLSWGLARVNHSQAAREELGTAETLLGQAIDRTRGDPIHLAVYAVYRVRIEQALESLPPDAPLSAADGGPIDVRERLSPVERHKYDRLAYVSRIFSPPQDVDPFERWRRMDEPFAGIALLSTPERLAELFDQMLANMDSLSVERRAMELSELLEYLEALPEQLAIPRLRCALPFVASTPLAERPRLLRNALLLADYYDRPDLISEVLAALAHSDAELTEQLPAGYAELLTRCAPVFRRSNRESQLASLLTKLEEHVAGETELTGVIAQLHVAAGFAAIGETDRVEVAIASAHKLLPELAPRDYKILLREIALALARSTPDQAIMGARALMERLSVTTDQMSTNSHYCIAVVQLMDAVVISLAGGDLALSRWAQLWIEEDEYLLRRRINRDLVSIR